MDKRNSIELDLSEKIENYEKIFRAAGIGDQFENIEIIPAALEGQHFSSSIDYVRVRNGNGQVFELFVKKIGGKPENAKVLREMKLFDKEAGFFNIYLKDLNKFIRDLGTDYDMDMVPKCYYANGELAVLENLAKKNYSIFSQTERHDLKHAELVMKTYGRFHAPSYLMIKEKFSCVQDFLKKYPFLDNPIVYAKSVETYGDWVVSTFQTARNILKSNDSDDCKYAVEIIDQLGKDLMAQIRSHFELESGHLCFVLNHADGWNCNLMFQKNLNEIHPNHLMLIDFQITNVATPNYDISYYLFTTADHQVRQKEWKNLLRIYYDSLVESVTALGKTIEFSFEDLLDDYRRKFIPGFIYGVCLSACLDAIPNVGNLDMIEGNWMEHVCKVIDNWIQSNPEKAAQITQQLSSMFQEYKMLISD